jgi:hypothetical protein
MDWLPVPRTKQGWIAAVALAFCAFLLYYLLLFRVLQEFYEGALYTAKSGKIVPVNCEEHQEVLQQLKIRVSSPRYTAPFGTRWFFATIYNNSQQPIKDVKLWIELQPSKSEQEQEAELWILPSLFGDSPLVEKSLYISQMEPGSTISGRFLLYATSDAKVIVWLHIYNNCIAQVNAGLPPITINLPKYLAHSFVENILLPPWSNGVIIGIVLLACYIMEGRENEKNRVAVSAADISAIILKAMRWLLSILAITFITVSLPWLDSLKGFALVLLFMLFLIDLYAREFAGLLKKLRMCAPKLCEVCKKFLRYVKGPGLRVVFAIIIMGALWGVSWRIGKDVEPLLINAAVSLGLKKFLSKFTKSGGTNEPRSGKQREAVIYRDQGQP